MKLSDSLNLPPSIGVAFLEFGILLGCIGLVYPTLTEVLLHVDRTLGDGEHELGDGTHEPTTWDLKKGVLRVGPSAILSSLFAEQLAMRGGPPVGSLESFSLYALGSTILLAIFTVVDVKNRTRLEEATGT